MERESNVPLHCWGLLDSARRVTVYYELSGPTGDPTSRTKHARCTDDGQFTEQEKAAMRARALDK
ncbi:hypothetical protein [Nocardia flavorosea]|uniref:Uncharacterized protein n=1 Tax=Nocardia flavorosea TaxID=53429 RepID=A0A846YIJ8_9NOCA|nr:hypothetical protein [Nocardia flavorosea]NKY57402.1 hypothetical protein [Nocardia flavorosea]